MTLNPNEDNYFCVDGGGWDDEAGAGAGAGGFAVAPGAFCGAAAGLGAADADSGLPPLPAVGGNGGTCRLEFPAAPAAALGGGAFRFAG